MNILKSFCIGGLCLATLSPALATPSETPVSETQVKAPRAILKLQPMGILLRQDKRLSEFESLVKAAKLYPILNARGAYTLFAPSNAALANLPGDFRTQLSENKALRKRFVLSHLVKGKITSDFFSQLNRLRTVSEENILFTRSEGSIELNNSRLLATDLNASNGIVHIVDSSLYQNSQLSQR